MECKHNYFPLNPGQTYDKIAKDEDGNRTCLHYECNSYAMLFCTKCGTTKEVIAKELE